MYPSVHIFLDLAGSNGGSAKLHIFNGNFGRRPKFTTSLAEKSSSSQSRYKVASTELNNRHQSVSVSMLTDLSCLIHPVPQKLGQQQRQPEVSFAGCMIVLIFTDA